MEFDDELNLGGLGESAFDQLCRAGKMTPIPSEHEDKYGWDFLVEFPYAKTDLPEDLRPKPIECKVQVKSTQGTKGSWDIKLSALKRLVDYTSPAFILFFDFSDAEPYQLQNAYLVHVDENLIYRILKKIRENSGKSTPEKLHKLNLSISYRKYKLDELTGKTLREKIVSYIPAGIESYQQQKVAITKRVGYENGGIEGQFSANSADIEKYCLDLILGNDSTLNIGAWVTTDKRFNDEDAAVVIHESDGGKLQITSSPHVISQGRVDFKKGKFSPAISFQAEILQAPPLILKPNTFFIKTDLFTLEVDMPLPETPETESKPLKGKIKFHDTLNNKTTLGECLKWLRLFDKCSCREYNVFELFFANIGESIKGNISLPINPEHDFSLLITSVTKIINQFELDRSMTLHLSELINSTHYFVALAKIFDCDIEALTLAPEVEDHNAPENICTIQPVFVKLGLSVVGCITRVEAQKIDGIYRAYDLKILEQYNFSEAPSSEFIQNLIDDYENELRTELESARLNPPTNINPH